MKKTLTLLAILLALPALGADTVLQSDKVKFGKPATSTDKVLEFNAGLGASNPQIKLNKTTGKLQFSNDGSLFKDVGSGGGGGSGINLLVDNPGLEAGVTQNMSASAPSTVTAVTGSSALFETTSFNFFPTLSGQTYETQAYAVPKGLQGAPCLAAIYYTSAEVTSPTNGAVYSGTNTLLSAQVPFTRNVGPAMPLYIPFTCPTSGSVKIRMTSTGGVTSGLIGDNMHLGSETRLKEVTQASMYGTNTFPDASGCDWNSSSSAFSDYPANGSCPLGVATGRLVASVTKTPTVEAPNAPAGTYEVLYVPGYIAAHAGTNCRYTVTDESNVGSTIQSFSTTTATNNHAVPLAGVFNYSTAASHTFKVRVASSDNSTNCALNNDGNQGQYIVKYYPTQSQTITQGSGQASSWSGYFPASRYWTTNSGPFADPSPQGSGSLIERDNQNFGTVSGYSGSLPGITFSPAKMGRYHVCFRSKLGNNNAPTNAAEVQLIDQDGVQLGTDDSYTLETRPSTMVVCGNVNFSSLAPRSLRLQMAAGGSSVSTLGFGTADGLQITIFQLDAGQAAVAYPGVIEGPVGSPRLIHAYAALNNAGSVNRSSGNWITLGSHPSTGDFVYTLSTFSGIPSCTCTAGGSTSTLCSVNAISSTSVEVSLRQVEAAAFVDAAHDLICLGPK
jgi:hypothetical protein